MYKKLKRLFTAKKCGLVRNEDVSPKFEGLEARMLLSGTIYIVDSLGDDVALDGKVTLREAILAANTNTQVGTAMAGSATEVDEIAFSSALLLGGGGTIELGSRLEITESVIIYGQGAHLLTIDGMSNGGVFGVSGGSTNVQISGLTITGGLFGAGSGMRIDDASVSLSDMVISGNTSTSLGGGLMLVNGELDLENTTVAGNTSGTNGGGIHNEGGVITIVDSTISGNSVGNQGGGIFNNGGTVNIANSTIEGNRSEAEGGGIYNSSGFAHIMNTTFVGNHGSAGGGMNNFNGFLEMANNTIAGNSATGLGGGLLTTGLNVTINNTIIAYNGVGGVSGTFNGDNNIVDLGTLAAGELFVSDPDDGGDGWGDDPNTGGVDESSNDDYGNLHLSVTSLAINAGDAALLPADALDVDDDDDVIESLPVDKDGHQRVVGSGPDIGAYEYVVLGDANYDNLVNIQDLSLLASNFGNTLSVNTILRDNWGLGDFNNDRKVNIQDLSVLANNFGTEGPEGFPPAVAVSVLGSGSRDGGAILLNMNAGGEDEAYSPAHGHIQDILNDEDESQLV